MIEPAFLRHGHEGLRLIFILLFILFLIVILLLILLALRDSFRRLSRRYVYPSIAD